MAVQAVSVAVAPQAEQRCFGKDIKDYPNAYHQFENEVTLPLHTRLTDEDVAYVIGNFVACIREAILS